MRPPPWGAIPTDPNELLRIAAYARKIADILDCLYCYEDDARHVRSLAAGLEAQALADMAPA